MPDNRFISKDPPNIQSIKEKEEKIKILFSKSNNERESNPFGFLTPTVEENFFDANQKAPFIAQYRPIKKVKNLIAKTMKKIFNFEDGTKGFLDNIFGSENRIETYEIKAGDPRKSNKLEYIVRLNEEDKREIKVFKIINFYHPKFILNLLISPLICLTIFLTTHNKWLALVLVTEPVSCIVHLANKLPSVKSAHNKKHFLSSPWAKLSLFGLFELVLWLIKAASYISLENLIS